MIFAFAAASAVIATLPAAMFLTNLPLFRLSKRLRDKFAGESSSSIRPSSNPPVSVLIPARDEEAGIERSVRAALASQGVEIEVVVLDDDSTDRTREIVDSLVQQDNRVRCESSATLPHGWNGKQHACWQLAKLARHEQILFIDADVRLQPHAIAVLQEYQRQSEADLLSAFPHQETGTISEKLIIPLMQYILLGYLPFGRMRWSNAPSLAAGCGQLFFTAKGTYEQAGTHEAIRSSRHDGVKLPRAYRNHALSTDVIDGTLLATCRMYRSLGEVVRGVTKNATEGIANPKTILIFTVLLLGGSVLPVVSLILALRAGHEFAALVSCGAIILGHLPRFVAAWSLRQSFLGALLHSVGVFLFVVLQWFALLSETFGMRADWRGRSS